MFEISLLSNWLVFFQTCDVWDLPSSKLNGFGQYFMVLIRNYSVHSWHLNFSPQIASVQTLKWPSAIASRPFESLHWCNFGEKFKCHSCDGTISTKIQMINSWKMKRYLRNLILSIPKSFNKNALNTISGEPFCDTLFNKPEKLGWKYLVFGYVKFLQVV